MAPLTRRAVTHPPHVFGLIWLGQLVSSLGSGLTIFAVSVHIYRSSASITQYSAASFFAFLPPVLLAPIAGVLADRWDRRRLMVMADTGAACAVVLMWLMVMADQRGLWSLRSWHFYLPLAMGSAFATFRSLAFSTSTVLLVPKQHLGRANGLNELALSVGQLLGPAVAGVLVVKLGLQGVLLIDLSTFCFVISVLLLVRIPRPEQDATTRPANRTLWADITLGWEFIRARPGLIGMLLFLTLVNLCTSMVTILFTPLVLSFADPQTLGWVVTCSGLGMLAGGLVMGAWGGPKRRIRGILGFNLLAGVALLAAALPASAVVVAGGAFVFMSTIPMVMGCSNAIWQSKVPPAVQGRVFAMRRMMALTAPPVGALFAGPLADTFFEPWMASGGALADSFGRVLGTGDGRGIALLYVTLGALLWVNVLVAWMSPRVRAVEEELPDTLPVQSLSPQR
jgi:DHA3 family macrolide efflux protein-like MFS transporter